MKAELRRLHSPDVLDLVSWTPSEKDFGVLIQLMVGPLCGQGEESFDVTVCTVAWLADRVMRARMLDLRHHVLVQAYDYHALESFFRKRVSNCSGASWPEVAAHVGRIGKWEFEDYRE